MRGSSEDKNAGAAASRLQEALCLSFQVGVCLPLLIGSKPRLLTATGESLLGIRETHVLVEKLAQHQPASTISKAGQSDASLSKLNDDEESSTKTIFKSTSSTSKKTASSRELESKPKKADPTAKQISKKSRRVN